MNPADTEQDGEPVSDLLAAYQEALATGRLSPGSGSQTPQLPELSERLARAEACLRRLEQDRLQTADSNGIQQNGYASVQGLALVEDGGIRHIGRWRVVRELGQGGSGIVYLAWDPLLQREVAVKVPRPEVLLTQELRRRFLREAQTAAGLEHPNLVPVYEAGEVGTFCYIVSAY